MKLYNKIATILFSGLACIACGTDEPGVDTIVPDQPSDDLILGGDVDMSDWPDYTRPAMSASGPSKVVYNQNVSTVNGEPFIPLGIYGVNQGDMPDVAAYGFNLIQSYQVSLDWTETQMLDWLDTAMENGLMAFVNLNGATLDDAKIEKIKNVVRNYKDHPAIYAWYLADEPRIANTVPAEITELYRWIRNEDPNHPVISSNWELNNFADACDVDMRQLYNGVPSRLTEGLENYMDGYGSYIKTWVAIVNSYESNWSNDGTVRNPDSMYSGLTEGTPEWEAAEAEAEFLIQNMKDPEAAGLRFSSSFPKTPELLRSSLYWSFVHGSNGFYYWLYSNKDNLNKRWGWYTIFHKPDLEATVQPVLDEFAQLSKFLINPGVSSTSFSDNNGIFVWSKVVDRRRVVILINESDFEYEGSVDLSELYIPGRTLQGYGGNDDGKEVTLEGNTLSGVFAPNETHVYFVK